MKQVRLSELEDKIVRPGFEGRLKPLLAYRGQLTLGRAHRLWNMMVSAMLHEASKSDITQRLVMNADYSQLCGPTKPLQSMGLIGFASRLRDNPKVMAEMPHMAEYVDWVIPPWKRFGLERISEVTHRSRNRGAGGWRVFQDRRTREFRLLSGRSAQPVLQYPFLIHDGGKPEHDLLRKVNAAIPRHYAPEMRADMCQDLIVGILCGDFREDDLGLPAKEMTKRVVQMFPTKYGPLSLDAPIGDERGATWLEMVADEGRDWA